ncbi:cytochrome-c peroxidase [Crateriforma conspicua]|uniref:Cytochrome c551 peroxidase n=1 Tax=Crateriforma conspicua TaxID=2527996 RepID=A0A5C5YBF3_9PLAN|nr:cytochrome-c peroxidase [Crateriforma conspicua]TWT70612.1 Cytochrome c551 peroxidase precursor [Crateriforma conspicua]
MMKEKETMETLARCMSVRAVAYCGLALMAGAVSTAAFAQDLEPLPDSAALSSDTVAKVQLGKKLYFDPRLSVTGTVSCNTCHNLMEGGDDGRISSMGVHGLTGARNAPTVWNSAFQGAQFWDGRAPTLEEQAKGPLVADVEMGMAHHDQVLQRIRKIPQYVDEFASVYGSDEGVTIELAVDAIAAFERTLITPDSALDRYLQGDATALMPAQKRGMELFDGVGCTECHGGPALNGWTPGEEIEYAEFPRYVDSPLVTKYDLASDTGRGALTEEALDENMFKTPTLRNISLTAPYMHNGRVPTLAEAVRVMAVSQLDMDLDERDVTDLVRFLEATEGPFPEISLPRLPSLSGQSIVKD